MRLAVTVVGCVALVATSSVRANGRFPNAGLVVVGPGASSDVIAVQLTFGLALSRDRGRHWNWICEDAYSVPTGWDPPLAIGHEGRVVLGLLTGISSSSDGCAWAPPTAPMLLPALDLAWDATGRTLVAGVGSSDFANGLTLSNDGGRTWREGARVPGVVLDTVEVAPSDPSRVYVTFNNFNRDAPALYRSDDGGRTLREVTRNFLGAQDAYLAGVDPRDPNIVYLRAQQGDPTSLLRSDDGGRSFRLMYTTARPMVGFALSSDGATVWVASVDRAEGILRSVRGGPFTRVRANATVRCMRSHADVLYVCGDLSADGYALACSTDGGDTLQPLLRLQDLEAPTVCAPGSEVRDRCEALWPAQRRLLLGLDAGVATPGRPHIDAGATPTDAGGDRPVGDVSATIDRSSADIGGEAIDAPEASVARDGGRSIAPPASRCNCSVVGRGTSVKGGLFVLAWALFALRRRYSEPRTSAPHPTSRFPAWVPPGRSTAGRSRHGRGLPKAGPHKRHGVIGARR